MVGAGVLILNDGRMAKNIKPENAPEVEKPICSCFSKCFKICFEICCSKGKTLFPVTIKNWFSNLYIYILPLAG
jgi:hypothetical protein